METIKIKTHDGFTSKRPYSMANQVALAITKQVVNVFGCVRGDKMSQTFVWQTRAFGLENVPPSVKANLKKEMKHIRKDKKNRLLDRHAEQYRYVPPEDLPEMAPIDSGWDIPEAPSNAPIASTATDFHPPPAEAPVPSDFPALASNIEGDKSKAASDKQKKAKKGKSGFIRKNKQASKTEETPEIEVLREAAADNMNTETPGSTPNSYEILKKDLTCKFTVVLRRAQLVKTSPETASPGGGRRDLQNKSLIIMIQELRDHSFAEEILGLFKIVGEKLFYFLDSLPVVITAESSNTQLPSVNSKPVLQKYSYLFTEDLLGPSATLYSALGPKSTNSWTYFDLDGSCPALYLASNLNSLLGSSEMELLELSEEAGSIYRNFYSPMMESVGDGNTSPYESEDEGLKMALKSRESQKF
jgi:hypothetical protein